MGIRSWFSEFEQDHACPIHQIKEDNRYTPLMAPYEYLKLKIRGVKSLRNDTDPIFLCTTCNKCHMAGLRYKVRQKLVKNSIVPHNLPYLQNAIKKYGNPYSSSRERQAFLGKNFATSSETALFLGCTSSLIPRIQKMATSAISLLEDTGTSFRLLPKESCCGYILYTMGDVEAAKEVAEKNMLMFEEEGVKRLVTACPGCYHAFKSFYPLRGVEVRHILEVIEPKKLPRDLTLTIHYPDHLNQLKGITRRMLKDNNVHRTHYPCCGVNLISYAPELSTEIARKMIGESNGPLVTYCPSCYLILSRIDKSKVEDLYSLLLSH
jgi:fumarate reductase (CoM/CoB) subunit B